MRNGARKARRAGHYINTVPPVKNPNKIRRSSGQTSRRKRRSRHAPDCLTLDEKDRLFKAIRAPRDRAIFALLYYHGLRASEPGKLMLSDYRRGSSLNLDRLAVTRLKGSISGETPLVPAAAEAIRAWLRRRGTLPGPLFPTREKTPISRKRIFFLMRRYCELAEIPVSKAHPHTLKHSTVTHLLERQETVVDVQRHVGHANVQSTMKYVNLGTPFDDARVRRLSKWR